MSKKKKPKPQTKKREPLFATERGKELLVVLETLLFILLFIATVSFGISGSEKNWLGAIGHSAAWVLLTTFGLSTYLITFAGVVHGLEKLLLKHEIKHPYRLFYFALVIFSLSSLLTLFSPGLGGLPFSYLLFDMPRFNLAHILGVPGSTLLFSALLLLSSLLFLEIPVSEGALRLIRWLKTKKEVAAKKEEKEKSDFMSLVKVRLPAIDDHWEPKVERKITLAPLPPAPTPPPTAPKLEKRDAALKAQRIVNGNYSAFDLPGEKLLALPKKVDQSQLKKDLEKKAIILEETLASFGIEAKVGQINCGPTIASFEVHPAVGVKVQKILALENDLALNMQAASIRIIAPIPGKACIGIEVPNPEPQEVGFRELLSAYKAGSKRHHIPLLLGKAVSGEIITCDMAKMPHLIIAGATGSGKSVCINTIVMSILFHAKPDEVQLLMVDPKKVELTPYSQLPHMIAPVITTPHEAYTAMMWLVKEMERRYEILNKLGIRNIEAFNARTIDKEKEHALPFEVPVKLPYIVGIIDELADLMMSANHDIETPITRIAQMARAIGIHLILATQRPSREVITGLIKANFPTRICFKVSSGINSKIVLDATGAEQLLGNGDMLFLPPGTANLERIQGAYIRDADIHAVIEHISSQAPANWRIPSFANISDSPDRDLFDPPSADKDTLYEQALDIVVTTGNASTTFLQRKLKIGYARAAGLMDQLETNGIVSPPDGSKARTVLAARET